MYIISGLVFFVNTFTRLRFPLFSSLVTRQYENNACKVIFLDSQRCCAAHARFIVIATALYPTTARLCVSDYTGEFLRRFLPQGLLLL